MRDHLRQLHYKQAGFSKNSPSASIFQTGSVEFLLLSPISLNPFYPELLLYTFQTGAGLDGCLGNLAIFAERWQSCVGMLLPLCPHQSGPDLRVSYRRQPQNKLAFQLMGSVVLVLTHLQFLKSENKKSESENKIKHNITKMFVQSVSTSHS